MKTTGFTLIETVLVIALIAIVSLSVAPGLMASFKNYELLTNRAASLGQAHFALERMVKELHQVSSINAISQINSNELSFEFPLGNLIEYSISNGNLMRNSDIACSNINQLNFRYFDEQGSLTNNKNNTRSIEINLVKNYSSGAQNINLKTRVFLRNTGNNYPTGFTIN